MKIKVTDYITDFLISKQINTIFGYPGGVICHLIDSIKKYEKQINLKINYHEQASAFAACAYSQAKNNIGVVISTSGPGATNLITGIANAWFDSIPIICITGQVDTYMIKENKNIRQYGFQETDIVSIAKPITKYCACIKEANKIRYELEKAFFCATHGRKGPVLIDIPANVQRAFVETNELKGYENLQNQEKTKHNIDTIANIINKAQRPLIIAGAGIKQSNKVVELRKFAKNWDIPVVTSMPAIDVIEYDNPLHCGFIGTNGHRYANIIMAKSDLIICLGSRLDIKQIGNKRNFFSDKTKLIRIDNDLNELEFKVLDNEYQFAYNLEDFFLGMKKYKKNFLNRDSNWLNIIKEIKNELKYANDNEQAHNYLRQISKVLPNNFQYTLDVGQNEVWAAQALEIKSSQNVYMSAGFGTMGYALPAAIGAYYANKKPVVCIVGDGGLQMNIQEMQFVSSQNLPITILLLNNKSLGMIRQFQEKNFEKNYYVTTSNTGYTVPNFEKIAKAYNFEYLLIKNMEQTKLLDFNDYKPKFIEIALPDTTYLKPNFGVECLFNQEPKINEKLFNRLINL